MSISKAIEQLHNELPSTVRLVAVSKYKPAEDIIEAYRAGQRLFGENRPQELAAKARVLPDDIQWHFIGHLQTNKLKMVLPYASIVESVDSEHLLRAIDSYAANMGRQVDCLLEMHIASEESKQGFNEEELTAILSRRDDFPNIKFRGLMGMASLTDDKALIRSDFRHLKAMFDKFSCIEGFDQLSMGMSGDYRIAIEEGTTIVRLGTAIFGKRNTK